MCKHDYIWNISVLKNFLVFPGLFSPDIVKMGQIEVCNVLMNILKLNQDDSFSFEHLIFLSVTSKIWVSRDDLTNIWH